MNLQIIKSRDGYPEYVLLPIAIYKKLQSQINTALSNTEDQYVAFDAADYVENPVALARIKAHLSQLELANLMEVTQAYISKIENAMTVSAKVKEKVRRAIEDNRTRK
jgi:DNA-binding XRE family transcriptional regulator